MEDAMVTFTETDFVGHLRLGALELVFEISVRSIRAKNRSLFQAFLLVMIRLLLISSFVFGLF